MEERRTMLSSDSVDGLLFHSFDPWGRGAGFRPARGGAGPSTHGEGERAKGRAFGSRGRGAGLWPARGGGGPLARGEGELAFGLLGEDAGRRPAGKGSGPLAH